jgi:hypothetical protein
LLSGRRDHFYINSTLLNDPSFHSAMYCW